MKKLFSVRAIILAGSLLLQLITFCFHSRGAAGDLDLSFDPGSGVNGPVSAVAVQPDGKVIIGGQFTRVKGLARYNVARLNADGSGDSSFTAGAFGQISGSVSELALQPDGMVLVGHAGGIARFHSDGSVDTNFTANLHSEYSDHGSIYSIAVQPDGKVLIGGYFQTVNGTNVLNGIARLNTNGSLDTSFSAGTGTSGAVVSVALQSDGKVLIGGGFNTVNGVARNKIARLNANGSLDNTFNPNTEAVVVISAVALQSDGKVLIVGYFSTVNGASRNGMARLNTNGSLDSGFDPGTGAGSSNSNYPPAVHSIAVQSDGKVLIGGNFSTINGTNRNNIARLNADGTLDTGFNSGTGSYSVVSSVVLQSDGKVLITGNRLARFNADGSEDSSFDPGTGVFYPIGSLALQPDGQVLLGNGQLGGLAGQAFINGTNRCGSARLNANGRWDNTFIPSTFIPGSFNPNIGDLGFPFDYMAITAFAVQSDGKVLVAAFYSEDVGYAYFYSYSITRHNADGSRDASFDPVVHNAPYGDNAFVAALAVQPDGKVLVGGSFSTIKGITRYGLARLNTNGGLDASFIGQVTIYAKVDFVVVQTDGKVIIAGGFGSVNGVARNRIARLNEDGSLDSDFNPETGVGGSYSASFPAIRSVIVQPDGKVLLGGDFTTLNGANRSGIARLNANGSLDSSFDPGLGADGIVYSIALQSNGNVLIGGEFTTVNGVVRPHVARLYGDSVAPSLNIARSNAFVIVSWPVSGLIFQLQESTNLSLPNSWSPVSQPTVTNAGQISVTVPTTVGQKFFRLKSP